MESSEIVKYFLGAIITLGCVLLSWLHLRINRLDDVKVSRFQLKDLEKLIDRMFDIVQKDLEEIKKELREHRKTEKDTK